MNIKTDFYRKIIFSDDSHFWLNGFVNKKNIGCQKSLAVFPQAFLCKRVVLVVFVASVHARAFWKALFTR